MKRIFRRGSSSKPSVGDRKQPLIGRRGGQGDVVILDEPSSSGESQQQQQRGTTTQQHAAAAKPPELLSPPGQLIQQHQQQQQQPKREDPPDNDNVATTDPPPSTASHNNTNPLSVIAPTSATEKESPPPLPHVPSPPVILPPKITKSMPYGLKPAVTKESSSGKEDDDDIVVAPVSGNVAESVSGSDYQAMEDNDEIPSSSGTGKAADTLAWLMNRARNALPLAPSAAAKSTAAGIDPPPAGDGVMKDDESSEAPPATDDIPSKIPSEKGMGALSRRLAAYLTTPGVLYALVFAAMAAGFIFGAVKQFALMRRIDWDEQLWVAFAGSSYFFVNDIPRLVEVISDGQVVQDSCLHSGGSLAALLMTGNGMYYRWMTQEAYISSDFTAGVDGIYDYGACSVHQLISGADNYLQYGNGNNAYYDDGSNPCFQNEDYFEYVVNKYTNYPPKWDYVVLADQSKRMASSHGRNDTIDALVSVYAPLIQGAGAIPIIVDTHAFWSDNANMSGLYDVPTFTQLIYEGVQEYAEALGSQLPSEQKPLIVPIGLAYLTVWEENYEIWQLMFLSDQIHASLYGSYFFAVVLYTKLFGHLPRKSIAIPLDDHAEYLYGYSRKNLGDTSRYPGEDVAKYLNAVAKRVVLKGHIPKSFTKKRSTETTTDDAYNANSSSYGGDDDSSNR